MGGYFAGNKNNSYDVTKCKFIIFLIEIIS